MLNKMKIALAGSIAAAAMLATPAQADTATVGADAEIVSAVVIDNVNDIDFGTIASAATAGSAYIAPFGGATSSCLTVVCVGASNVGSFDVTGAFGFNIDLGFGTDLASSTGVTTVTLTSAAGDVMSLDAELSQASLSASGAADTVYVGGTLNVGANQAAGTYSGTMDVVADYQ